MSWGITKILTTIYTFTNHFLWPCTLFPNAFLMYFFSILPTRNDSFLAYFELSFHFQLPITCLSPVKYKMFKKWLHYFPHLLGAMQPSIRSMGFFSKRHLWSLDSVGICKIHVLCSFLLYWWFFGLVLLCQSYMQ